jgi:plastocyanin
MRVGGKEGIQMLKICRLPLAAVVAIAIPVLILAAPASGGAGARASKEVARVSVKDDVFSPKVARVDSGGKVIWRWRGSNDHNVRFRSAPKGAKRPRGSTIQDSGRFARSFSRRGTYRYVCTLHEDSGMKGRVVVD